VTPNDIQAICALAGFAALACLIRAAYALLQWSNARHLAQLDTEYRAFVMVEEAKRMRDWLRWEDDTLCGTFPNRAARDAALVAAHARHAAAEAAL